MRSFVVLLTVVSVSLSGMAIASQPQLSGAANTNNPTALQGSFLYEQLPAPPELLLSAASQEFPDVPSFTIFAADDFTVPDGPGWNVQDLHSFFTTGNGSGLPALGMRWIIWDDDPEAGSVPGDEVLSILGGDYDQTTGLASIDLSAIGEDVNLPPGDYWFTSQIIGEISFFGQEFHMGSLAGEGTENFHWNNPGGGFGMPEGWLDAFGTINGKTGEPWSDTANLAFQIGGTIIPEPGSLLSLLGLTTLFAARRRRSHRRDE